MAKPAACRRSSATRANSGVPAKMMRKSLKTEPYFLSLGPPIMSMPGCARPTTPPSSKYTQ